MLVKNNAENDEFIKNKESLIIYSEKRVEIDLIIAEYNNIVELYKKATKSKDNIECLNYLNRAYKFIELCEEKQSNLINSSVFIILAYFHINFNILTSIFKY